MVLAQVQLLWDLPQNERETSVLVQGRIYRRRNVREQDRVYAMVVKDHSTVQGLVV